ncbi:hypothetical protein BBBOND_0307900 [Babesia bigemina]|uniref:Ribosome-binding protein 1 n=1 Tax=Babesia bigemina TaxID=5866 RepID=A0A061D879_BABBI|nr:hypothetical protein BBBOND_0307900 [Babesia bigemina]CDR96886.1 hypothetical protein BBBOND_0307900 [Babesia bigemina]|eukprot:XP_012769072.1 hypothetical protein BBBOND_0307900 [Babesia bigemina]
MAKSNVPTFKTLKECLEFLQWLHTDKGMQYRVTRRLVRLLEKKYITYNTKDVESALSTFLRSVSTFHEKLCNRAGQGNYNLGKATHALYALLQCIPKFLSVMYFMRYQVDEKFGAVGGGGWKNDWTGWGALGPNFESRGGELDKYLYERAGEAYGVIPGGFDKGGKEVKYRGGYFQGRDMASDLINICDKKIGQLFRDVFVTSVLSKTSGVDVSNVANALRVVRDFCGIFEDSTNEEEFKSHVQSRDKCINWNELKKHCLTLKEKISKLFTDNRFSFTGYGRKYEFFDKSIDKRMASWLKKNLSGMKNNLEKIKPFSGVIRFNSRTFQKGKPLPPGYTEAFKMYFTDNFFRYGFTFFGNTYDTRNAPYDVLQTDWDSVIGDLRKDNGDLDELKKILDGTPCPIKEKRKDKESESGPKPMTGPEPEPEPEPEPGFESESESESESEYSEEAKSLKKSRVEAPPAKVPETPKEVVPEKKVAAPKKPEVPLEINSAGNQNQGKKAESAQNQGKKAEGNQNQGNDHSVANTSISPVSQAVRTQSSSVQSPDSGSPGATGPSSGPGPGGQADVSDAGQPGVQKAQANGDANGTASNTPGAGSVGDVGNGGSGGPGHQGENPQVPVDNCPSSKGFMKIKLWRDGGTYCVRQADYNEQEKRNKKWDEQQREYDKRMEQIRIEEQEAQQKQEVNQGRKDARAYRKEVVNDQRETLESMERKPQQIHDQYPSELRQMQQEQLLALEGSVITNTKPRAHMDVDKVYRHTLSDVDGRMISDTDRAVVAFYGDEFGRGEIPPVEAVPSTKSHVSDVIGMPTASIAVPAPPVSYHPSRENRLGMIPPVEAVPSTKSHVSDVIGMPTASIAVPAPPVSYHPSRENRLGMIPPVEAVPSTKSHVSDVIGMPTASIVVPAPPVSYHPSRENRLGMIPPVEAVPSTKSHVSDVIGMPTASIAVPAPPVSYHPSRENRLGMIPPVEAVPSTKSHVSDVIGMPTASIVVPAPPVSYHPSRENRLGMIPPVEAVQSTKSHVSDVIGMPTASIAVPAPPVSYHPSRENRLGMIPPPVEENPSTNDQRDSTLKPDDISVGGSVIPMMPFPGVYNIELSLPQKPKVQVIPNPKQRSPLPPIALSEYSGHHYYIPSKYPFIATVDDQTVEKMLNVTGTSNKLQTAQIVGDSNVATLSTPELTGNIISAFKQDPRTSRFPPTSKPYGDDDDASVEYASAVTFNDNIMKTMAGVAGHPVVGTNGQVDISQIPTAISLDAGDIHHLEGQEIEDSFTMKRQEQDLLNFQNEELKQGSQNAQRERELLALKQESDHINEEQKKLMQAAQVDADRIRAFKDSQFDISSAPLRVDEMQFDIQIDVPKRPLQDSSYDIDLDDPYANTADILKDELKPSDDEGFSGLPNTNFDLNFAPERIGLDGYEDPGMPSDSPRKASERVINPFSTDECLNPWSVDTSTSSTDTIQPPTSPPPASDHLPPPRTVREMLYWFVGLNTYGYIGIITQHIKSILKRFKNDAIEVTLEPYTLDASHVADKLTEACLYSATVIYKIKHTNVSDAFKDFFKDKEKYAYYYSPDPACLLCQLRDYVYACHHQLQFLKAQCKRDKLSGGWQDCKYGSDIKTPSPLQAFLTDDWDSKFKTHPFDPCNLCLKSRVRMGFKKDDLPKISQQGSVLSNILTPSCGGEGDGDDDVRGGECYSHLAAHLIDHQCNHHFVYNIRCQLPVGLLRSAAQ